ncbi:MAG: HEAT repeat domain-containing protein [Deltaproteobacteria bacterium]|nr:HEAT repeat domain-containing protein [Deltaproteobacteria bacterium]
MTLPLLVAAVDRSQVPLYVLGGTVFVALIVWVFIAAIRGTRKANAELALLERELGLRRDGEESWRGEVDGLGLAIAWVRQKSSKKSASIYELHVTITGLPREVHLGAEGFVARLTKRDLDQVHGLDIPIGDPTFDGAVKVKGDASAALALLDAETRDALRQAVADGWILADGAWRHVSHGVSSVYEHVKRGLELARLVRSASGDVPARLAARAVDEPLPGVRGRALELLLAEHRHAPTSAPAFEAATMDVPENRLIVARGLPDLASLLALARGDRQPESIRVGALDALVERVADVMGEGRASTVALVEGWMTSATPALRRAAARALGRLPTENAEALLVAALADTDDDVQLEAVRALGAIGTVAAVPALVPLRERLLGSELKSAAQAATLAIRARSRAEAGALALAEDAGALALAED